MLPKIISTRDNTNNSKNTNEYGLKTAKVKASYLTLFTDVLLSVDPASTFFPYWLAEFYMKSRKIPRSNVQNTLAWHQSHWHNDNSKLPKNGVTLESFYTFYPALISKNIIFWDVWIKMMVYNTALDWCKFFFIFHIVIKDKFRVTSSKGGVSSDEGL